MSRRQAFVAFAASAVMASSCRTEPKADSIPAAVPGYYVYAATGAVLGKNWRFAANLDLKPDGTFALAVDKTMDGATDLTERASGTYTVSGDKIWITESKDAGGFRSRGSHSLVIRPDSLIGEIGWKDHLVLRGIGIPDPVFVKRRSI